MPKTKKQRILVIVLVLVILVVAVVIWWTLAPPKEEVSETLTPAALKPEAKLMRKMPTKLDFSIFDHPWFKKARIHGDLPVEAGVTGRENPFKPY